MEKEEKTFFSRDTCKGIKCPHKVCFISLLSI